MTDVLFQMGLSNACFSLALAIVATVVGAATKRPQVAHLLWLLVLVKLLTPPIVMIPLGTVSEQLDIARVPLLANSRDIADDPRREASLSSLIRSVVLSHGKPVLLVCWLLGSVFVLAWSLFRVYRFSRLLSTESEVTPQELRTAAAEIAGTFGLGAVPTICTTSARLSPMVWWTGGKVRVVIPTKLLDRMNAQQWRWILAHELAHVRRRDYLVRWLEWLACVAFWWNPVVWWAQRSLRAMEEICCDDLVMSCLNPKPHSYANSILMAVESVASAALRPPAMASEVNSGGFLEKRFKMMVLDNASRSASRWLQACVLLCAVAVLPFGVAASDDTSVSTGADDAAAETVEAAPAKDDLSAIGRRIRAAVAAGEITEEQGRDRMAAVREGLATRDDIGRRIRAAVAAGEMTAEEGRSKMDAARERLVARDDIDGIGRRLRRAVELGEMAAEALRAQMAEIRKELAAADLERGLWMRVRGEIEAGEITREEAQARFDAYMVQVSADELERGLWMRVRGEIEAGEITREEAQARFDAYMEQVSAEDED